MNPAEVPQRPSLEHTAQIVSSAERAGYDPNGDPGVQGEVAPMPDPDVQTARRLAVVAGAKEALEAGKASQGQPTEAERVAGYQADARATLAAAKAATEAERAAASARLHGPNAA